MKDKILDWLTSGRTGVSSEAMARAVTGLPQNSRWGSSTPSDPDDLNRCLLFLKAVPEAREHMDKVAALSEDWAKLVKNWDVLEKTFLDEVGLDWHKAKSAPKTYVLMKKLGC